MNKNKKIFVAGHKGMVGSAIYRKLIERGYTNLLLKSHENLDLTSQLQTEQFFKNENPEVVILAAAKVGGIKANSENKAEFYYINNMIANNVIHYSYKYRVEKLINLGSSCIYPRLAPQPLEEEYLLTGSLEPTNDAYAIAKIAAIKMCEFYNEQYNTNFMSLMPTNLYGRNDNYNLESSHVLPAMIRKFHEAEQNKSSVVLWGDGSALREFMCADDLSDAVLFLMEKYDYKNIGTFVNVGTGKEITIKELATIIANIVGFKGKIIWDKEKPNGTPRKLLDVSKLEKLGWVSKIELKKGIEDTYNWFKREIAG